MKTALKILTALAAVVGAICVLSLYGEKIIAWCKKIVTITVNDAPEVVEEEPVTEEAPAEEAAAEEPAAEEAPAEEAEPEVEVEIVIEENEPVAEEADFEA